MCFGCSKEPSHRNTSFECLKHNFAIEGKQPKHRFGCIRGPSHRNGSFKHPNRMFSLKCAKSTSQKAHNVGPPTACQRYAISMAYRWWAVDGPTLCASWDGDPMTVGRR